MSRANRLLPDEELLALLTQARQRNAEHAITGMLLYKDMSFIQVLEGNDRDIDEIFASINNDMRHSRIRVLLREPISTRVFEDWSMGFQNLNGLDSDAIEGYSHFLNPASSVESLSESPSSALNLLHYFRSRS